MAGKLKEVWRKLFRTIRVVYYNMGDGPDQIKLEDLEEIWAQNPEVIALSEHADRIDVTTKFVEAHPEYDQYFGDGRPGAAKECLLYRKDLGELTLKKTHTLVGPRKLGEGAGPENATAKCALHLRFRVKQGKRRRRLHVIVGHQYATVNNRREAAKLFMRALADLVRRLVGAVIVMGDMNMVPSHALMHALMVLMTGSDVGATHGKRQIDRILVRAATILSAWTRRGSSDHRMVFADIRI